MLGEEAKTFATEKICCWNKVDQRVLKRCFQIAESTPEVQKAIEEMFDSWDTLNSYLRIIILSAPFSTRLRTKYSKEILRKWHIYDRRLVVVALKTFNNDPDAVVNTCKSIISRWHKEISYQHKRNYQKSDGHIIKSLSHPSLEKEAYVVACEMLDYEKNKTGFLSPLLYQKAKNITQGNRPSWTTYKPEGSINLVK